MQIRCERVRIRYELRMTPQQYQFMQHKGQLITRMRSFCIDLTVHILKFKYFVFMKIRPLIGRRIRIR